jgi:hypothetical protein
MTDTQVLTFGQMMLAGTVGVTRRAAHTSRGWQQRFGAPPASNGGWEIDVMACQAEMAVALYLNLFWCASLNDFGQRDVGGLVEVRACSQEHYRLILHEDDPDDAPFVHVWAHSPEFTFKGWIFGRDGKRRDFWEDPAGGRPAFFVPNDQLRPMHELKEWVRAQRSDA